jgi:glycosyltransferase involved in cell wall biosynthesis
MAMLTHSYYEEDPRVRREAEALVARGWPVDVFALRRPGDPRDSELNGVRIHRVDVQRHQGAGLGTYLREYLSFLVRSGWAVTRSHRRRRYAVLHVHTLPDFLVFAGLPLKLRRVPILLDLHEAMPEFYRTRFPRASNPLAHRLLLAQERASIAFASAVLTVNDALRDRLVGLGVPADKVTVILNSPSLALFDPGAQPRRAFAQDGQVRIVYAGALSPTYELDVALAGLARLAAQRPDLRVRFDVYGRDFGEGELAAEAARLGVSDRVTFHGRIPLEAVPAALAGADIGLAPTRRNSFTDFSLSTKIFEYGAMDKPVIASRLPMVEQMFPAGTVATYTPGDPDDLAAAILRIVDRPAERDAAVRATAERVRELAWDHEAERLAGLVDRLAAERHAIPRSGPEPTDAPSR